MKSLIPDPNTLMEKDPDFIRTFTDSVKIDLRRAYDNATAKMMTNPEASLSEQEKVAIGHKVGKIPFDIALQGDEATLTLSGTCRISWDGHRFLVEDITIISRK